MKYLNNIQRNILYIVIIFCLYFLQTNFFSYVQIFDSVPEIAFCGIIIYSMLEGEKKGAIIGLIIGLIYDSQSITVGFNSVLFMLFAYIVGVSIIFMLRKNIFSAITLTVTGVLIQSIITILFFYINKGNNSFLYSFLHLVIPKIIVTVIFLIPIYFIFNAIGKNISIERRV